MDNYYSDGNFSCNTTDTSESDTAENNHHLLLLQQKFRIRINAANLPSKGIRGIIKNNNTPPDTFAVITSMESYINDDDNQNNHEFHQNVSTKQNKSTIIWGKTEIVRASRNPQYTTTIPIEYTIGSNITFYIHLFRHVPNHNNNSNNESTTTTTTTTKSIHYGTAQFHMIDLLSTRYTTRMKRLRGDNAGCIYCRLERILPHIASNHCNDNQNQSSSSLKIQMQIQAMNLIPRGGKKSGMFLVRNKESIDTILEISKPDRNEWIVIHRSSPVHGSLNPSYDTLTMHVDDLCWSDDTESSTGSTYSNWCDQPLRISIYAITTTAQQHRSLIGITETTIKNLLSNSSNVNLKEENDDNSGNVIKLKLQRSIQKIKEVGELNIYNPSLYSDDGIQQLTIPNTMQTTSQCRSPLPVTAFHPLPVQSTVDERTTTSSIHYHEQFAHYISNGCQIEFCVAIDFTSSNGHPNDPNSNHYHNSTNSLNDYEETIVTIGNTLAQYSPCTNECCVWGFGAKYNGIVRHIFQCGTPTVHGVSGILAAYHSVFQSDLIMSGPTNFTQVIQAAASKAKRNHDNIHERLRYTVLLIITDGIMDNFEETKEQLDRYTSIPLSIIFVGVGRSDFTKMYQLCHRPIRNNDSREIATFVEIRNHQHDVLSLGDAAFHKIPVQLCQYMQLQGIRL